MSPSRTHIIHTHRHTQVKIRSAGGETAVADDRTGYRICLQGVRVLVSSSHARSCKPVDLTLPPATEDSLEASLATPELTCQRVTGVRGEQRAAAVASARFRVWLDGLRALHSMDRIRSCWLRQAHLRASPEHWGQGRVRGAFNVPKVGQE